MNFYSAAMGCAALLLAHPAFAQEETVADGGLTPEMSDAFDRGCGDDRGIDRCDSKTQQRMHSMYGLSSPAEALDAGVSLRRAMFVDGYGNDVAAVSFVHRPGEAPAVEVASPPISGMLAPQPLRATISAKTWRKVLSSSRHFDKMLASELPQVGEDGKPIAPRSFCLHAWFTVVEAVDAPRPSPNTMGSVVSGAGNSGPSFQVPEIPGKIRSDAESACGDGLAQAYAFDLAEIAFTSLPECAGLDPDSFRNLPELLRACSRLGGDRVTASEAMPIAKALNYGGLDSEQAAIALFAGRSKAKFASFTEDLRGATPYFLAPTSAGPHDASLRGRIVWLDKERKVPTEMADITLNLKRVFDEFRIDSWSIGERVPYAEN